MPFVPVNDVIEVNMCFQWDSQRVQNVYHVLFSGGTAIDDLAPLGETFVTWWDTYCKMYAPPAFQLDRVILRDLSTQEAPGIEYTVGLPIVGTAVGSFFPNNVTLAVKWLTDIRGRSYRGRTYFMPLDRSFVINNYAQPAGLVILTTMFTSLQTAIEADVQRQMVIVSKYHNKIARTAGVATHITGLSINNVVDSQRRRLPERGA